MPAGRPPNLDKRIAHLIAQLKRALAAREQQRIEAQVAGQVDALVRGLQGSGDGAPVKRGPGRPRKDAIAVLAPAAAPVRRRKPRSAASRAQQAKKMKAYWAAKRKAGGK
jgi:hypothetical protein